MTQEELNEYNRLTPRQKQFYNMGMEDHPDWSHQQAVTYAIVCGSVSVTVDPPPTGDPIKEALKVAIRKAQEFLRNDFPRIYMQVKEKFTQVLNRLNNAISATWNAIIEWFNS